MKRLQRPRSAPAAVIFRLPDYTPDGTGRLYVEADAEGGRYIPAGGIWKLPRLTWCLAHLRPVCADDVIILPGDQPENGRHVIYRRVRPSGADYQRPAWRPGPGGIQPSQSDYWLATKSAGHGIFTCLCFRSFHCAGDGGFGFRCV